MHRDVGEILAYLRSLQRDVETLYEAKLVLVGEGAVGKSSLLAAMRNEAFEENRPTTHGIQINSLGVPHPDSAEGGPRTCHPVAYACYSNQRADR